MAPIRFETVQLREEWLVQGVCPAGGNETFLFAAVNTKEAAEQIADLFNGLSALLAEQYAAKSSPALYPVPLVGLD